MQKTKENNHKASRQLNYINANYPQ